MQSWPTPPIADGRIDWFRVIVDIERSGLAQWEIGQAIGMSQTQVRAYKSIPNTEPRFHVGLMLLALWAERKAGNRTDDGKHSPRSSERSEPCPVVSSRLLA